MSFCIRRFYSSLKRSPYEVLNLSKTASTQEIKVKYKQLAKHFHPDKKETGDLAKFQEIVQAYEILVNPNKRSFYAHYGNDHNRPPSYTNAPWSSNTKVEERFAKNTTFLSVLAGLVVAIGTLNLFYFQSSHAMLLNAADEHHLKSSRDLKRARTEAKLFGNDRGMKRVIDSRMNVFRAPQKSSDQDVEDKR